MPSLKTGFSNIYLRVLLKKVRTTLKIRPLLAHEMPMSKFFKFKATAADISGVTLMPFRHLDWSDNCYTAKNTVISPDFLV